MFQFTFEFEDSPDSEVISSGLNQKEPGSVALGRQGNFFLWGFSTPPAGLTPEARRCLVNAVCYIKKFDGRRPIVRRADNPFSRGRALMVAHDAKFVRDKAGYGSLYPEAARDFPAELERPREAEIHGIGAMFPESVPKRAVGDPAAYVAWVGENYEWLRRAGDDPAIWQVGIDDDVRSLDRSNHEVALLEECVAMLERGDRPELALRVLRRYTTEDFAASRGWRSWLEAHRGRLFFTESGGSKFMVAPESPGVPARLPLDGHRTPTAREPVVVEARCSPARVGAEEETTLVVRVEMAPSWHIAAVRGSKGPEAATSLSLTLPRGVVAVGDWSYPEATPAREGVGSTRGPSNFAAGSASAGLPRRVRSPRPAPSATRRATRSRAGRLRG